MIKIQFILPICLMACLFACQSEPEVSTAVKKAKNHTKQVAEKVIEEVANPADEMKSEASSEPTLKEFYVEEDKAAKAKKNAIDKANKAKKTEAKKTETKKTETKKNTEPEIAQKKPAKSKRKSSPKMKFTNDTFEFGIIKPGDVIEHKFEFTNTGNADLIITDAKATCGCTQPSFPFIPIPPGEKGFIGVKYDSTGKLGTQKPTVTITTNASPKTRKVYLDGLVISKLSKN